MTMQGAKSVTAMTKKTLQNESEGKLKMYEKNHKTYQI